MEDNNLFQLWKQDPHNKLALDAARNKIIKLTEKELEVLHLMVAGEPNKIIAYNLGISERTVENHRKNIVNKTGCKSLSALTCLFMLTMKDCLPFCAMTGKCNHHYHDCPIEQQLSRNHDPK